MKKLKNEENFFLHAKLGFSKNLCNNKNGFKIKKEDNVTQRL